MKLAIYLRVAVTEVYSMFTFVYIDLCVILLGAKYNWFGQSSLEKGRKILVTKLIASLNRGIEGALEKP